MAKKKSDKEKDTESKVPSTNKFTAFFKNETIHFVIGLVLVIFSVYLLLAFSSFFFTGAADQSIIDSGNPHDLSTVNNHVKNYAGSRGAQLASYLYIVVFYPCFSGGGRFEADACANCPVVEMVYRLFVIACLVFRIFRLRLYGYLSGFIYLSGRPAWI